MDLAKAVRAVRVIRVMRAAKSHDASSYGQTRGIEAVPKERQIASIARESAIRDAYTAIARDESAATSNLKAKATAFTAVAAAGRSAILGRIPRAIISRQVRALNLRARRQNQGEDNQSTPGCGGQQRQAI
jgi:hypothetical protein